MLTYTDKRPSHSYLLKLSFSIYTCSLFSAMLNCAMYLMPLLFGVNNCLYGHLLSVFCVFTEPLSEAIFCPVEM